MVVASARSLHEEGWKNEDHWLVGYHACDGIGSWANKLAGWLVSVLRRKCLVVIKIIHFLCYCKTFTCTCTYLILKWNASRNDRGGIIRLMNNLWRWMLIVQVSIILLHKIWSSVFGIFVKKLIILIWLILLFKK